MPVPDWQPGYQYLPGDVVRPTGQGDVGQYNLNNPDLEDGNTGWTFAGSGSAEITAATPLFSGAWSMKLGRTSNPNGGGGTYTNNARLPVVPGQIVTVRAFVQGTVGVAPPEDTSRLQLYIVWYNSTLTEMLAASLPLDGTSVGGFARIDAAGLSGHAVQAFTPIENQAIAPAGAAYWTVRVGAAYGDTWFTIDEITYEYANQEAVSPFLFRAVQALSGFSGATEPDWPTVLGQQVVDNEVTWEAISANSITWQATRILVSGDSAEPTWPEIVGGSVVDNTIVWVLEPRRVTDPKVPATIPTVIAASKVFRGDSDIIRFSATVNPLDWTTPEDAGYLPFAQQDYGSNPVTALALYRGNVAAFNSEGCQIWQVNEDPEAMAMLDAVPIPCTFDKSLAPVGDDLLFLTDEGIRSLQYAGASVNLRAGFIGQPIDSLVTSRFTDMEENDWIPRGLYWPAQGQYWLFFGPEAFVLTRTGEGRAMKQSWSRYLFPGDIEYWTIKGTKLFLRSGDTIWEIDKDALYDDQRYEDAALVGTDIVGEVQWPHLDMGRVGSDITMKAFDLTITGTCNVIIGWDQSESQDYAPSSVWTAPYGVDGDTLPKKPIPFEVTGPSLALRLEFDPGQAWEWFRATLYVDDTEQ